MGDEIRELFPRSSRSSRLKRCLKARPMPAPPPTPSLRQIGDYRVIREVGRGGMGVVYEAEQISLGRRVALKVMPRGIAKDHNGQERFRREARAAARLHHTNIVPVFQVGQDGEVVFYAMQFIQGQGLDVVINELAPSARIPAAHPPRPWPPEAKRNGMARRAARSSKAVPGRDACLRCRFTPAPRRWRLRSECGRSAGWRSRS